LISFICVSMYDFSTRHGAVRLISIAWGDWFDSDSDFDSAQAVDEIFNLQQQRMS